MSIDLRKIRDATLVVVALRALYTVVLATGQSIHTADPSPFRLSTMPDDLPGQLYWHLINSWMYRDAVYFAQIAADGYDPSAGLTAFHPLFPLLSGIAGWPVGSAPIGLWIVSTASAIGLTVVTARYTAEVHGERWANAAATALVVMPVGFVWLLFYTDAMFVAFAVACLLYLHRGSWWTAALFGALATLTRQQGIVLLLPMIVEIWRHDRRPAALFAPILIPVAYAGFAIYRVFFLQDVALADLDGFDATMRAFIVSDAAHEIAPGQRIAWPWEPLVDQMKLFFGGGEVHLLLDTVLGLGIVAFVASRWKQLTTAELLYCAGCTAVALCYYNGVLAPYMALPRHVIILFPVGFLLAKAVADKPAAAVVAVGLAFNLLLALLFATERWIP